VIQLAEHSSSSCSSARSQPDNSVATERNQSWAYDPARMWPGAGRLDKSRLARDIVSWRPTRTMPVIDDGWTLVPDLGLKVFATITCINTGDVWEVGRGAREHMTRAFNEPTAAIQRLLSAAVMKETDVESVATKLRLTKELKTTDHKKKFQAIEEVQTEFYKVQSTAWSRLRLENASFQAMLHQLQVLRMHKDKYVERLRKATSEILASVGKQGRVLFPTNLMDQRKRGRASLSSQIPRYEMVSLTDTH